MNWLSLYRLWSCAVGLLLATCLPAQDSTWLHTLVQRFQGDTVERGTPRVLAYPTLAYAPETRWEFGVSAALLYYARQDPVHNRLSEVTAFAFYTLERQYGIWMDHAIYSDADKWIWLGRMRQQRFPLLYYGIGPGAAESPAAVIDARSTLLRERILHRVRHNLFAGLEVDFNRLAGVEADLSLISGLPGGVPVGISGSRNIGLGGALVYDSRHNYLNVRTGEFMELAGLLYRPAWGSDFVSQYLVLDMRRYRSPVAGQVWAGQFYMQLQRGEVPFNQLALMGGESLMRGYYLGRYRDQCYAAAQTEYRWLPFPFSRRWGAAVFAGVGTVGATAGDLLRAPVRVAGGGGLRLLIFPQKDIFLRVDVGLTREGPGYYVFLGEAF